MVGGKYVAGSPGSLLGTDNESMSSEISTSERERFDDVAETILLELETVCLDEQNFSIQFFKMEIRSAFDPSIEFQFWIVLCVMSLSHPKLFKLHRHIPFL